MSEVDFKAWAAQAARDREAAIEQITTEKNATLRERVIEKLSGELNRL